MYCFVHNQNSGLADQTEWAIRYVVSGPTSPNIERIGWPIRFGQRGKIPAQIPIFPAKSLVHVMKAPQDRLSTHSRVCAELALKVCEVVVSIVS